MIIVLIAIRPEPLRQRTAVLRDAQATEHGKDDELMRDPIPPAEARAPRDDFLRALGAEALEELVDDQASTGPGQAALSVELPPLRLEDAGHGFCSGDGVGAAAALREHSTGSARRRCLL